MIDSNGSISWGAPIILIILISHNWVFPRVRNICRLHSAALVLVSTHHNMTRPHQRRNLGPWPGQPGSGPDMIIKYSRFVQNLFPTKWSKLKPYCYRPNSFPIKTWRRYVTTDEVNFRLSSLRLEILRCAESPWDLSCVKPQGPPPLSVHLSGWSRLPPTILRTSFSHGNTSELRALFCCNSLHSLAIKISVVNAASTSLGY